MELQTLPTSVNAPILGLSSNQRQLNELSYMSDLNPAEGFQYPPAACFTELFSLQHTTCISRSCTCISAASCPIQISSVTHHFLRMFCSKRVSLRSERWNWMMGSWSQWWWISLAKWSWLAASWLLGCFYVSMSHILVWFNMIHSIMVGSQAHQNVLRELMLVLLQDCFEFLQRPSLTLPTLLVCFTFSCHYLRTHLYYIYNYIYVWYVCV